MLFDPKLDGHKDIIDEKSIQVLDEDVRASSNLNEKQKHAYDVIMKRIYDNKSELFFVDGPWGIGKTFLYHALHANIRSNGMIALATTTSKVTASISLGGHTTHSGFNIPLQTNDSTIYTISKQSSRAEIIRLAKNFIWDEAPIVMRHTIEAIDKTFRDIMNKPTIL